MSITFEHEADVLLWVFGRLINIFREKQYLFAAQCVWWLAALVRLQPALAYYFDHQEFPLEIRQSATTQSRTILSGNIVSTLELQERREVSSTLRDIQQESRLLEPENSLDNTSTYIPDRLRRTRKGRVNPRPETKKQLKAARIKKRREELLHRLQQE